MGIGLEGQGGDWVRTSYHVNAYIMILMDWSLD